jgi:hypothetical protein
VEVAVDCFEVRDIQGNRLTILSVVDMETLYHTALLRLSPTMVVLHLQEHAPMLFGVSG